jgi:Type VI secretion system/phage-baseplate injector OB domain
MMNVVSDDEKYFGVYRAVVIGSDDPLQLGRVQITVPGVSNGAPWATIVVPSTGQDGGVPPAVGTAVVIAFEAGNPERPYVLGHVLAARGGAVGSWVLLDAVEGVSYVSQRRLDWTTHRTALLPNPQWSTVGNRIRV